MNSKLRDELLAMRDEDVSTRAILVDRGELGGETYHPEMRAVHEKNTKRMKEIIHKHGWPLQSDVGEDGVEAAWLVVQHAVLEQEFQQACLPLLEAAVDAGEAHGWHLAYLQDRILIQQGRPQIYGTQHEVRDGKVVPMATREPDRVNEKRAKLGLWSQAAHTAHLQRDYDMNQKNKELNAEHKSH